MPMDQFLDYKGNLGDIRDSLQIIYSVRICTDSSYYKQLSTCLNMLE